MSQSDLGRAFSLWLVDRHVNQLWRFKCCCMLSRLVPIGTVSSVSGPAVKKKNNEVGNTYI